MQADVEVGGSPGRGGHVAWSQAALPAFPPELGAAGPQGPGQAFSPAQDGHSQALLGVVCPFAHPHRCLQIKTKRTF